MDKTVSIEQYKSVLAENAELKFELEKLKRMLFGRSTERFVSQQVDPEQLNLFVDQQESNQQAETEPLKERITYERNKPKAKLHPGRTPLPEHFPVEEVVIEPEEDTTNLVKIGEQISEYVEYSPASLTIIRTIRPKYAKPDKQDLHTKVLIAKLPSRPIPKSIAGASLLAFIIVAKFVDHMPFYRQIKQFERQYRWSIHKSTINSWFVAVCTLLEPLYREHKKQILAQTYLQADESRIRVLTQTPRDKNGKPKKIDITKKGTKQQLGWMWVVRCPQTKQVLFCYEDNRGKKAANKTLKNFKGGYLQVDGYASYDIVTAREDVQRLGCWAHVRRKFFDAKPNDLKRAEYALFVIQQIYEHERKTAAWTSQKRKTYRKTNLRPIFNNFKDWLDENAVYVTPKSPIGQAFTYAQKQWSTLMTIFDDGRLLIDNNHIENAIRPLALGRKNYLFAGSHHAAQRIAIIYSLLATCKEHDVNPLLWLTKTLQCIPETKISQLHTLLPRFAGKSEKVKM